MEARNDLKKTVSWK